MMKPKQLLGWILVALGILFLLTGLVVTVFATVPTSGDNSIQSNQDLPSSVWVELANSVMDFTLRLLAIEWTPTRVGIFLIIVGMVLEGVGAYSLMSMIV